MILSCLPLGRYNNTILMFLFIVCGVLLTSGLLAHGLIHEQVGEIEGLAEEFCNEFECNSSPALEPTVRLLARDIETSVDGNRALKFYSDTCTYKVPALLLSSFMNVF